MVGVCRSTCKQNHSAVKNKDATDGRRVFVLSFERAFFEIRSFTPIKARISLTAKAKQ